MSESIPEMNTREPAEQIAGRIIGMVVFLAGIVMLVFVFIIAYQAFQNPGTFIPQASLQQTPPPPPAQVYLPAILRLILLFAMGYLGSLIAARGAQLFYSAKQEVRRVSAGD